MNEAKKLLQERLKELKSQEASLRKDQMKLKDRVASADDHLVDVVNLVKQFEDAIKILEG